MLNANEERSIFVLFRVWPLRFKVYGFGFGLRRQNMAKSKGLEKRTAPEDAAHNILYHSTLGLGANKEKKKKMLDANKERRVFELSFGVGVWLKKCRTPCLLANRATLPQKWPPLPPERGRFVQTDCDDYAAACVCAFAVCFECWRCRVRCVWGSCCSAIAPDVPESFLEAGGKVVSTRGCMFFCRDCPYIVQCHSMYYGEHGVGGFVSEGGERIFSTFKAGSVKHKELLRERGVVQSARGRGGRAMSFAVPGTFLPELRPVSVNNKPRDFRVRLLKPDCPS